MKKFFLGLLVGISITAAGSVYADEGLQKIEAYLRPSLPITLDGNKVTLESPPVMYDGSTYLKLRDIAKLTGLGVNWNDTTQTVELTTSKVGAKMTVSQDQLVTEETSLMDLEIITAAIKNANEYNVKLKIGEDTIENDNKFPAVIVGPNTYVPATIFKDFAQFSKPNITFKITGLPELTSNAMGEYTSGTSVFLKDAIIYVNPSYLGLTTHIDGDTLIIEKQ